MAGTQNVLNTYGKTGEMDAATFDKAFTDGFWSPETGAVESVKNVASGKGTWQDVGGSQARETNLKLNAAKQKVFNSLTGN